MILTHAEHCPCIVCEAIMTTKASEHETVTVVLYAPESDVFVELAPVEAGWAVIDAVNEVGETITLTAEQRAKAIEQAILGVDETGR